MHARLRLLLVSALWLVLGACATGGGSSPSNPGSTGGPASPALTPVIPPGPVATATEAATPSVGDGGAATAPAEPEAALLHGVRLDLQDKCTAWRNDLPAGATGAIECAPSSDVAGLVTLVVFDTQAGLLDAYWARVEAEGIEPRTNGGRCEPGVASEGGYVPGDGHPGFEPVERGACWLDAAGTAHYVATQPPFILLRVDGRAGSTIGGVERFAWLGNQDQPGGPTLWAEEPRSPEK